MSINIDTSIDGIIHIEAGSQTASSIEQALDRAENSKEFNEILSSQHDFNINISSFDRMGYMWCRKIPDAHEHQPDLKITISEQTVESFTSSVSTSLGASISSSITAKLGFSAGGIEAGGEASLSSTLNAAREMSESVTRQITRSIGREIVLSVKYHADMCYENNNPYGLCFEVTISGKIIVKQKARKGKDSAGREHWYLTGEAEIVGLVVDDLDASLDGCVRKDPNPKRIPGCEPTEKVGYVPSSDPKKREDVATKVQKNK